jgi:hypothetical protein
MSRLTGTDAYGLMEAYGAVYAPQELTEEQVWEEVETWVNSLLEEGYDLSDYTWEEMYESYLSELNMDKYSGPPEKPKQIVRRPMASMGPNYADQKQNLVKRQIDFQIGTSRQGSAGGNSGLSNIPAPKPARDVVVKAALKGQPGTLNKTTGKFTAYHSVNTSTKTRCCSCYD